MPADRCVLEIVSFLFSGEDPGIRAQRFPIGLEREDVTGLLVLDLAGILLGSCWDLAGDGAARHPPPIASTATMAPSIAIVSGSAGMAAVSLDLAFALPRPERSRRMPGHWPPACGEGGKAALERFRAERGEDAAQTIVRGRAVLERPEPAQQLDFLRAGPCDAGEGVRSGHNREQA